MTEKANITEQNYWEGYYEKTIVEKENIIRICSQYDPYWDKLINACKYKPSNIIEIGGYPGRYLAYISSKYQLKPCCLDFNVDTSKLKESFKCMGVSEYDVIQSDFEKYSSDKKYDLLFSHGFIEHFNNYDSILDKHAALLNEGGSLMVTVPNKKNFRYLYGWLLDRKNLRLHNTKCMKKKVFMDFVKRNNLELVDFAYYGGFPYAVHQELNIVQRAAYAVLKRFFKAVNPFLSKHPNKYTCSLLICIARKPLQNG